MNLALTADDRMAIRPGAAAPAADQDDALRRRAWTAFWADQGPQSRCLAAAAPETDRALADHWASFASALPSGSRLLDIGCGSGVVARLLTSAQPRMQVFGVDSARVPNRNADHLPQIRIFSGVAIEALPFADGVFGAAVSQFGFEYGKIDAAAQELARVLKAGARFSFIVHHSESPVVGASRKHNDGLRALTGERVRNAFLAGEEEALNAQLDLLGRRHPDDATIAFAARCLLLKVGAAARARVAIWEAVLDALAPDRTLSDALESCCVAPDRLQEWLEPLRARFAVDQPAALVASGEPLGWKIAGVRRA